VRSDVDIVLVHGVGSFPLYGTPFEGTVLPYRECCIAANDQFSLDAIQKLIYADSIAPA
jgi:hypothetical protein